MKIRKQILTEELGLPRNNKKSYTTNKKQKVVISEGQLQRLINKVNKQQPLINERIHDYDSDNPMGGPWDKNPWDTHNTGGGGGEPKLDEFGVIINERRRKPAPTSPKGGYKCYRCAEGGPIGYTSFKPCPKAHSHPKKLKCCCKLPNGNIVPPQSIGNQGIVCPKNAQPVGGSCNNSSSSSSTRYRIDAGGCLACPAGTPASVCPYTSMPQCNSALANYGNNNSNNNVTAQCCQDPQGNQVAGSCPNNCVAPNTCGNCVALSENHRTLKTTNPINESEIRNMKGWFNRLNKTGNKYNPSII
jgi:hypothetical protein